MVGVTVDGLLERVGRAYPITNEEYPGADLSTPRTRLKFAIEHSHKHLSKIVGKLAAQVEEMDHGGPIDQPELEVITAKTLISVLNLAHKLGLSGHRLAGLVPEHL